MATNTEIISCLHQIGNLDEAAVKIAEDMKGCAIAQATAAKCANDLYDVMTKEAGFVTGGDNVTKFCDWINKVAREQNVAIPEDLQLKIAAAISVDESLDKVDLKTEKLAELRNFSREFIMHLLQKAF